MKAVFSLRKVEVYYGSNRALAVEELNLAQGRSVALVGPSGSGKSTLLGLLNARLRPQMGEVQAFGQSWEEGGARALRARRARIAWVPQDLGLVGSLRVSQNVLSGAGGRHGTWGFWRKVFLPTRAELEEVRATLARLGVAEKLLARADQLSGGQRQRVAVARALFQQPEVILADEPVSSVDPQRARRLLELLVRLAREEGCTLVASLHDRGLAEELFDELVGLRAGEVLFQGRPKEIAPAQWEELYRLQDDEDELD